MIRSLCRLPSVVAGPSPTAVWALQVRGAKRRGVKMQRAIREAKFGLPFRHPLEAAKRRKKAMTLEAERNPKVPTLAEINAAREKEIAESPCLQFPGRQFPEEVTQLAEAPNDDVWLAAQYRRQKHSLKDALAMHRERMHPSILNHPKAGVRLRIELNMNTDVKGKKTIGSVKGIVELPHPVPQSGKRTIMAFVKDPNVAIKAREAGAEMIGPPEMIKKIIKGQVPIDDVDYFVCYVDMLADIVPLRGLLRHKFPTKANHGLGSDIERLIALHLDGTEFELVQDPIRPTWGLCDMLVGSLDMADADLEANIRTLMHQICTYRQMSPSLGHFFNDALVMAEGSDEFFSLDVAALAPPVPETEPENARKKKKKTPELKSVEEIAAQMDAVEIKEAKAVS